MTPAGLVNGLSVDVEDWFQVGAFEGVIDRGSWTSLDDRVERNCERILEMFAAADVHATFFTLGWVAQRHGGLMRRIVDAGHELALAPGLRRQTEDERQRERDTERDGCGFELDVHAQTPGRGTPLSDAEC